MIPTLGLKVLPTLDYLDFLGDVSSEIEQRKLILSLWKKRGCKPTRWTAVPHALPNNGRLTFLKLFKVVTSRILRELLRSPLRKFES